LQRQTGVALSARRAAGARIEAQPGEPVLEGCHFIDGGKPRTFEQQQLRSVWAQLDERRGRLVEDLGDGRRRLPVLRRGNRRGEYQQGGDVAQGAPGAR